MYKQVKARGWGVLALIVPWGVIGMAVNLTQGQTSPSRIWVWAAAVCIVSTITVPRVLKVLRRTGR